MSARLQGLLVAALLVTTPGIVLGQSAPTPETPPKKSAAHPTAAKANPPKAPATKAAAPADDAAKPAAPAQPAAGLALGAGTGPTTIDADDGIEMQQSNKVYVAHGNAVAKRADRTLRGDTLMAFYRDIENSDQTEIWRVVADGHVTLSTPTQTVEADHGVYDLDAKTAVFTGKHLKMTTPKDLVTAKDTLEWYDDKQFAVARGDAVGIRADRRIRADVLTAQLAQAPGEASRISIVNGSGHVIASRPDEIGTGDRGIYDLDRGIVTLIGHVTLARGENTLRGEYGVMDMEKGVSRMLPRMPTASDPTHGRVEGYVVPKKKPAADGTSATSATIGPANSRLAPATPPALPPDPEVAQKGQTNPPDPH